MLKFGKETNQRQTVSTPHNHLLHLRTLRQLSLILVDMTLLSWLCRLVLHEHRPLLILILVSFLNPFQIS